MFSINIDEADPENKINQFINDISNFNKKYIFQCYKKQYSIYMKTHVTYHP